MRQVIALLMGLVMAANVAAGEKKIVKYARFQAGDTVAYGIVDGDTIRQLDGDLFNNPKTTDRTHKLADVKLLAPCKPTKVFAMAGNYKSHLGSDTVTTITSVTKLTTDPKTNVTKSDSKTDVDFYKPGMVPQKFQLPQIFYKLPTCIVATGDNIVLPADSKDVHYEGEMVIVIGKKARNISEDVALEYVFGVTCGNDVSERIWQKGDVQWWRAKGSDTFGPIGPYIVSGLNYDDLRLTLKVNGKMLQDERTKDMIHNTPKMVSFISKYVTLEPGDVIFSGTPQKTTALKPGDVVEVEIEGVGILKNSVVAEKVGAR